MHAPHFFYKPQLNPPTPPQGFLEHSPVFFGFYKQGSLNLACLNLALLYLAGILSILVLSLLLAVRR